MTTRLDEARIRLRQAIGSGSYAQAQECLEAYGQAVSAALAETGIPVEWRKKTLGEALDLLRWSGRAVRAGRAHTLKELARVASSRHYRTQPPAPAAKIQLLG
ncbi:MAG TPA: hypothetical protein VLH09_11750 [Bryobacteraceae bacterium]|nr:hypothetical protein [Bryobacteraceae bacterium]